MLTSLGAGSSSIMCVCECIISGLWGGALSRLVCACSHVAGSCLGTHSELNPRTIVTLKSLKTTRILHGIVFNSLISLAITCACEFISGLWVAPYQGLLCACSHVEGTCLGTHSELNPRTIVTLKRLETTRTLHGRVFKSSNLLSLSLSLSLSQMGNAFKTVSRLQSHHPRDSR